MYPTTMFPFFRSRQALRGRRSVLALVLAGAFAALAAAPAHADPVIPDDVEVVIYDDHVVLMKDGRLWVPPSDDQGAGRGTPGTGTTIELALVGDAAFVERYGSESEAHLCELAADAGKLFAESLNATFDVVATAAILNTTDPYTVDPDLAGETDPLDLLSAFTSWAGANITEPHDSAVLVSGRDFGGSVTGFAFTSTMCTGNSTAIVQDFGLLAFDAATIAHEMGHNLGMCHDPPAVRSPAFCADLGGIGSPEETCAGFLMAASTSLTSVADEFSVCSVADHDNWRGAFSSACLDAPTSPAPVDCSAHLCPADPLTGCAQAAKTSIKVARGKKAKQNQVKWNWKKGAELVLADLGNPSATTGYSLCLYDGVGGLPLEVSRTRAAAGSKWTSKGDKGWNYKDRDATPAGVAKIGLKTGEAGKSKISFQAKGVNLSLPSLATATQYFELLPSLRAQLINSDGKCWEATYVAADTKKNDAAQFKAATK